MPEVTALKVGKQLEVLQPKNTRFTQLPRNERMITVSGGGKTNAHIQTLTQPWGLAGLFDKYVIMSPNAFTDPKHKVLADYIEPTTGQKNGTASLLNGTHRSSWIPWLRCEK